MPENCQITAEIAYHGTQYGIAIVDRSILDSSPSVINIDDYLTVRQSINENGSNILRIRGNGISNGFPNVSSLPDAKIDESTAGKTYTLKVEIQDGKIRAWINGYGTNETENKWYDLPADFDMSQKTVVLYSSGGNLSLIHI